MNNYFVILAAGKSKRFHKNIAKQFYKYKNKEIIDHSVEKSLNSNLFRKVLVVTNNVNYFKKNTEIYKGMRLIDEELGGTTPLDVVLTFNTDDDLFISIDDEEEIHHQLI